MCSIEYMICSYRLYSLRDNGEIAHQMSVQSRGDENKVAPLKSFVSSSLIGGEI